MILEKAPLMAGISWMLLCKPLSAHYKFASVVFYWKIIKMFAKEVPITSKSSSADGILDICSVQLL